MNRLLCAFLSLLLMLPAAAQPVKTTFTGMTESMDHIPSYEEGKAFYLNPYAGGQSGNLVILKESPGKFRIWDNASELWVSESFEDCAALFFINPDMLFLGKTNDRCIILHTSLLDGFKPEDKYLWFTDWRFYKNSRNEILHVLLAMNGKWGLMDPAGHFLVPTRYDTPGAAEAALRERRKAEIPLDMNEMDFIISEIKRMNKVQDNDDFVFLDSLPLDWSWYDPVSGSLFYTLGKLPWAGPYCRFTGDYTYKEPEREEGTRYSITNATLGVEDGVLSFIINGDLSAHPGKLMPLTTQTAYALHGDPKPITGTNGDEFYSLYKPERPGRIYGMRLNKDSSFQIGYFSGSENADGSVTIRNFLCVNEDWRYMDFLRHYAASEHNKGYDPTDEQVLEAFRKQVCPSSVNNHFRLTTWPSNYDETTGTIGLDIVPICEVRIPMSRAEANAFIKEYDREYNTYQNLDRYYISFDRKVRDNGEVYIDNLKLTSPSGIHFEYKDK